jgi:hypothetical protein
MISKQQLRRIQMEIRHVLLNVWDPIGIKDEPMRRMNTTAAWVT